MIQLFQTFHSAFFYLCSSSPSWSCFLSFLCLVKIYKDNNWRRRVTTSVTHGKDHRVTLATRAHRTSTRSGRRWMIVINQDRIQSAVDQKPCSDYIIMRACRRGEDWSHARGTSGGAPRGSLDDRMSARVDGYASLPRAELAVFQVPSRRVYAEQWGPPMRSNRGVLRTWVWRGKWRNEMDWWTVEFGDNVDT